MESATGAWRRRSRAATAVARNRAAVARNPAAAWNRADAVPIPLASAWILPSSLPGAVSAVACRQQQGVLLALELAAWEACGFSARIILLYRWLTITQSWKPSGRGESKS